MKNIYVAIDNTLAPKAIKIFDDFDFAETEIKQQIRECFQNCLAIRGEKYREIIKDAFDEGKYKSDIDTPREFEYKENYFNYYVLTIPAPDDVKITDIELDEIDAQDYSDTAKYFCGDWIAQYWSEWLDTEWQLLSNKQ
jgi:hypothetical protein